MFLSCRCYLECPAPSKSSTCRPCQHGLVSRRGLGSWGSHEVPALPSAFSCRCVCQKEVSFCSLAPPPGHTAYYVVLGFCRTQGDSQSSQSSFSLRQLCAAGLQGWDLVGTPSCSPSHQAPLYPWRLSPFRWWWQSSALLVQASQSKGQ